jgi:hypothetical protein
MALLKVCTMASRTLNIPTRGIIKGLYNGKQDIEQTDTFTINRCYDKQSTKQLDRWMSPCLFGYNKQNTSNEYIML